MFYIQECQPRTLEVLLVEKNISQSVGLRLSSFHQLCLVKFSVAFFCVILFGIVQVGHLNGPPTWQTRVHLVCV